MIPKKLKQTGQKASSLVKEIVSSTEIKSSGKQSTIQKQKGKYKAKTFSDKIKLKRKLFEDDKFDEALEERDQVQIQDFISSTKMLSFGDSKEQNDLQKQSKGINIYLLV